MQSVRRKVQYRGLYAAKPSLATRLKTSTPIRERLNISKLFFSHAEIVSQFVHEGLADLMADFCLVRTDRFNILLIEHDVGWTCR